MHSSFSYMLFLIASGISVKVVTTGLFIKVVSGRQQQRSPLNGNLCSLVFHPGKFTLGWLVDFFFFSQWLYSCNVSQNAWCPLVNAKQHTECSFALDSWLYPDIWGLKERENSTRLTYSKSHSMLAFKYLNTLLCFSCARLLFSSWSVQRAAVFPYCVNHSEMWSQSWLPLGIMSEAASIVAFALVVMPVCTLPDSLLASPRVLQLCHSPQLLLFDSFANRWTWRPGCDLPILSMRCLQGHIYTSGY